jgi:glycerol-3-phosphate acyltransferase PlsX
MKLSIDVMGFENDLNEAILACRHFQKQHQDVEFILVGNEDKIKSCLKSNDHFKIVNATDIIQMQDNPLTAIRRVDSSMYKAIKLVADNKADGVLSAGSTPIYVSLVYYLLRLIPGVNKPAFMPYLPTINKKGLMLLDVGANKECTGQDLYQFALMSSIYCFNVRKISNPSIGVVNIGTEANKGFAYHKEADELLKQNKKLNYVGFVEPRTLLDGNVDIAVTDGFVGNITLKSLEGGLQSIKKVLKDKYKKP